MPKTNIDYSNTIIYKIFCKDDNVKDLYVGHTTNFAKRKYSHKMGVNDLTNNTKIYKAIRENGGWENWDMVEIAKYECKDVTEARIKECEHYDELKASLNAHPPYVDTEIFVCDICNVQCVGQNNYNKHLEGERHELNLKKINDNETEIKLNKKMYICEKCDFKCNKKYNFNRHLITEKHLKIDEDLKAEKNKGVNYLKKNFKCDICGNSYRHKQNLWRHKQKCIESTDTTSEQITNINNKYDLIMFLIKENSEFKDIIIKQQKQQETMIKILEESIASKFNNTT